MEATKMALSEKDYSTFKDSSIYFSKRDKTKIEKMRGKITVISTVCPDYSNNGKEYTFWGQLGSGISLTARAHINFVPAFLENLEKDGLEVSWIILVADLPELVTEQTEIHFAGPQFFMITLMKIGPYSPIKNGLTKYESLKLLTLQKYDPGIDQSSINDFLRQSRYDFKTFGCVITSALTRAKETAIYLEKHRFLKDATPIISSRLINEIKFDISLLCGTTEYERDGSAIVRRRFVEFFITDRLSERRESIKGKCNNFKTELMALQSRYNNILCVSHSFFIKIFLAYMENPRLFLNPQILKKHIHPEKKTMEFCECVDMPIL